MATTRRFEFTDARSHKFWEITVTGKKVTVRYGRIGTEGQTQVKAHATPAEAKAVAEKQVAEKVKKGYREVGGEAAGTAPKASGVDEQQLKAIWELLGQDDLASVQQGIALLRALDDPAIWASLHGRVVTPSVAVLEFYVNSSFHADRWHDVTAGPWRVRIPGYETSGDQCRLVLPCSAPVLDALRECLGAEAARGEGLRNLNVLLTSIEHDEFERQDSKYEERGWSFDTLALYFEERRLWSWWDGTHRRYRTYNIDTPMPQGQFTLESVGDERDGAVATVPQESLAVLAELIEEVRALRDEDDISEDDRDNTIDILSVTGLTVNSPWSMVITKHESRGSSGWGDVILWEGPDSFDDPIEGLGILLGRVGSAVPQASDRKSLWPVVLSSTISKNEDARERQWTAAERKRRLKLARTAVEQFSAAASATLEAEAVYLFVGTANGEPGAPDRVTFAPSACRSGTGRWWKVEDALDTLLDASNAACLDAIDEGFFQFEEEVTLGIRTALPFIASHRGCAMSEVLDGADLGRDHTFGDVSVWDGEPHRFRFQSYAAGELDSGLFQGFSDEGGKDADTVREYYYQWRCMHQWRSRVSRSPDHAPRLLRLLSEAATQPDA